MHTAAVVLSSLLVLLSPSCCWAALNIGTFAADDLTTELRQKIFVETAYLSERREERCSSLDGPRCFQFMSGSSTFEGPAAEGPGVIPEKLLQDFGGERHHVEFYTPDYNKLDLLGKSLNDQFAKMAGTSLAQTADASKVRDARSATEQGFLHFADLRPDAQIPLSFSRGLPNQVVATWDGHWLVRDCGVAKSEGVGQAPGSLALPSPEDDTTDPYAPVLAKPHSQEVSAGGNREVASVAELAGSLGYLRFSQPVLIRSLFVRWTPSPGAPPAVIGGRLGLHTVWSSHLDPSKLSRTQGWMDISGDPLLPVDEIAFLAAQGLEIGAVEVAVHENDQADEQSVLMMAPMFPEEAEKAGLPNDGQPKFQLNVQKLSPGAAPYIVSLQEALDRNLKLNTEKSVGVLSVPGLMNGRSNQALADQVTQFISNTNQQMFDHSLLAQLAGQAYAVANKKPVGNAAGALVLKNKVLASAFREKSNENNMPADLRKEMLQERKEIMEALAVWFSAGQGGWHKSIPTTFPRHGTETAVEKYMKTKRCQSKLDLLTTSFLHVAADTVAQQAQESVTLAEESVKQQGAEQQALMQQAMQMMAQQMQQRKYR